MKQVAAGVFLALLLSFGAGWAGQLQASVSKRWTVDMARQEAFREAKPFVDVSRYPSIDPNFMENLAVRHKGGGKVGRRSITVFSSGGYGVYEYGAQESYFYKPNGELSAIVYIVAGENILKKYKHSALNIPGYAQGQLMRINLETPDSGQFIFKPNGTLTAHWVGDNCYNVDGSSCGTRKLLTY